jgi:hypothetical protein
MASKSPTTCWPAPGRDWAATSSPAAIGIGDPDVMARLPFAPHGFIIRRVGEIAAALQNSGLQVEQRRIDEKPMPRYLFIGRRD